MQSAFSILTCNFIVTILLTAVLCTIQVILHDRVHCMFTHFPVIAFNEKAAEAGKEAEQDRIMSQLKGGLYSPVH